MNLKKWLTTAISVLVVVFPIVITFLMIAEPALAQRSDRNLKQNIADVDVDQVLASLL
ncbi:MULTISPECIES: hypothetical protein [Moorena]|uniref:Uncharacterized protein n=1 Tax=Moorena producens (strain JHB) TaxID=1454205 RepID=A0A9Q9UVK5_MOOP1|nr:MULTISPECIES: hypothetical protein [Moorena]NEQ17436.1 hypothetical protein [Moorena sp. SIO3E2]NES84198.1 hypothetical protein [Moorena sp. SIO2B7]NEP32272.1 hypothetical protein [Moorena sp. SIO3B2]NEP69072.1 hypothetical protein [Moorena sp. SIO3A5]NEQ07460.1 hypothetical protein [Moorena sp. SIO4E2]